MKQPDFTTTSTEYFESFPAHTIAIYENRVMYKFNVFLIAFSTKLGRNISALAYHGHFTVVLIGPPPSKSITEATEEGQPLVYLSIRTNMFTI